MKLTKFQIAIIIAVLLVAFIAYMDIQGLGLWSSIDKGEDYTLGKQHELLPGFGGFFYTWAKVLMILLPVSYFLFYRREILEAAAIYLTSYLLLMFGLADILYFWFQNKAIPATLPWLSTHGVIGKVSSMFGFEGATSTSLFLSVGIGIGITYVMVRFFWEKTK